VSQGEQEQAPVEESDGPEQGELSEPEEAEQEEGEAPEAEDEQAEDDGEVEEAQLPPAPAPEANPLQKEIEFLRAEVAALKAPKQAPPAEPPKPSAEGVQFQRALYLAMYGQGEQDKSEWESLPASIKRDAADYVKIHAQREVEYALNPAKRFQDQIAPAVEQLVRQALEPIVKERQDRQAREVLATYMENLKDEGDRKSFAQIYREIPGSDSSDLGVQEKVLKLAYEKLQWSKKEAQLAAREQNATAAERQQKAIKTARKRAARNGAGAPSARKKAPDLKDGESLFDYAQKLANGDYDLD
jgi:hypothetical protein